MRAADAGIACASRAAVDVGQRIGLSSVEIDLLCVVRYGDEVDITVSREIFTVKTSRQTGSLTQIQAPHILATPAQWHLE